TPSAPAPFAMVRALSINALISSREYIKWDKATTAHETEQDTPPRGGVDRDDLRGVWNCLRAATVRRTLRAVQHPAEPEVRRTVRVRAGQVRDGAGRLLVARPAVVGAWLPDRRSESDADHEQRQLPERAPRDRHRHARRSGAVQVSARLHHRSELVDV